MLTWMLRLRSRGGSVMLGSRLVGLWDIEKMV
jgi:hypothetical protein